MVSAQRIAKKKTGHYLCVLWSQKRQKQCVLVYSNKSKRTSKHQINENAHQNIFKKIDVEHARLKT